MKWGFFSIVLVLVIHHHSSLDQLAAAHVVLPINKAKVRPQAPVVVLPKPKPKPKPKTVPAPPPEAFLSTAYYEKSCPNLEGIIQQKVRAWVLNKDYTIAASIIRLHFHDCAVRGCDASVLLNHAGSERRAEGSKTLRGFQLIDEIKAEVEKRCPKTVSCADILTAAARDATILVGGPFWEVPFGRRDGVVSLAREADRMVPQGHENITALINFFNSRGLNLLDLVVLSGSHTIGRSTCHSILHRLSSSPSTPITSNSNYNPPINTKYLYSLRKQCGWPKNTTMRMMNYVDLDATTPRTFDSIYYTNLLKKMGLLSTDQLLYSDARTSSLVSALATQPSLFTNQFAVSMVKLGNVQVITRKNQGQIRLNCNYINP